MDIKKFCKERPYLYHLTDGENLKAIRESKQLLSTSSIAQQALNIEDAKQFLRSKRPEHILLKVANRQFKIRDQRPISLVVLERSLEGNLNAGDFIELLNKRVFWWPNLDRLTRHYDRYSHENPVILRVKTDEMLALNGNVELCHLNSGATRCHPKYGGNAPTRGEKSFLSPANYSNTIGSVAEVTFVDSCQTPQNIWIGDSPNGTWHLLK